VIELRSLLPAFTLVGVLLFAVFYVLAYPERAERIAGWIWRGISRIFHAADRKAVAYSLQGDINSARAELIKDAPSGILDAKLRVRWADPEQAEAHLSEGEVVVFMRRSPYREENITNALIAYLPKAVIPRARPYIDRMTMQAVDLTLARSILALRQQPSGAMDVFFGRHLDPALAESADLRDVLEKVDAIDLHGWLTRIMLVEFQKLGEVLYPSQSDQLCIDDARAFGEWLGSLAASAPGDESTPLAYRGRFLRVSIVLVARKETLAEHDIAPYRKVAKQQIYSGNFDSLYLMGRDSNIAPVKNLVASLESDARIESIATYEFGLRADFKARVLHRERAIIVALRLRSATPSIEDPAGDAERQNNDPGHFERKV
jgi:hypothetical protein